VRQKNAQAANAVNFVRGLNEDSMLCVNRISGSDGAASDLSIAIGLDTTTAISSVAAYYSPANVGQINVLITEWTGLPGLGKHSLNALEFQATTTTTATFYGTTGRLVATGMF
jgi:hypothetical protein